MQMYCFASGSKCKPIPTGRRGAHAFALVHTKTSAWNNLFMLKSITNILNTLFEGYNIITLSGN